MFCPPGWVVSIRIFHCEVTYSLPPSFILYSLESSHNAQTTQRWWGFVIPHWGYSIYIHYLNYSAGEICSFSSFTYIIIYISMPDIYFIFCILIQYDFIHFLTQIFPTDHWKLFRLTPVFDVTSIIAGMFFSTFLLFRDTRCSMLISYISCPNPRISHFSTDPWVFFFENHLETVLRWKTGIAFPCWYHYIVICNTLVYLSVCKYVLWNKFGKQSAYREPLILAGLYGKKTKGSVSQKSRCLGGPLSSPWFSTWPQAHHVPAL